VTSPAPRVASLSSILASLPDPSALARRAPDAGPNEATFRIFKIAISPSSLLVSCTRPLEQCTRRKPRRDELSRVIRRVEQAARERERDRDRDGYGGWTEQKTRNFQNAPVAPISSAVEGKSDAVEGTRIQPEGWLTSRITSRRDERAKREVAKRRQSGASFHRVIRLSTVIVNRPFFLECTPPRIFTFSTPLRLTSPSDPSPSTLPSSARERAPPPGSGTEGGARSRTPWGNRGNRTSCNTAIHKLSGETRETCARLSEFQDGAYSHSGLTPENIFGRSRGDAARREGGGGGNGRRLRDDAGGRIRCRRKIRGAPRSQY